MSKKPYRKPGVKIVFSKRETARLLKRYLGGETIASLSLSYQVDVSVIRRIFRENKVASRGAGGQSKLRWAIRRGRAEPLTRKESSDRRIQKCFEAGLCCHCGKPNPATKSRGQNCAACMQRQKDRRDQRRESGLCTLCGAPIDEKPFKRCKSCRLKSRQETQIIKDKTFAAYGGYRCCCCGETEQIFLALDHIHNDGKEFRKIHGSGSTLYNWLRKNNYPPIMQPLCHNCNYAKEHGGCPHQKRSRANDHTDRTG